MPAPPLHLVYSTIDDYSDLTSPIVTGLFFILCVSASVIFILKKKYTFARILEGVDIVDGLKISLIGTLFTGAILYIFSSINIASFVNAQDAYKNNKLLFVEGRVSDYSPMPYEGHQNEYFKVKNVAFQFSDFEEGIGGYHNAASHGGVIKPNLYVRIGYYPTDFRNIILKLETE
ncbi:MAG: hypothetical protein V4456_17645 [Bacteroidota bacterium]